MVRWLSEAFNSISFCCSTDSRSDIFLWTIEISCSTWKWEQSVAWTPLWQGSIKLGVWISHYGWEHILNFFIHTVLNINISITNQTLLTCVCVRLDLVWWHTSLVAMDDMITCAITASEGPRSAGDQRHSRTCCTASDAQSQHLVHENTNTESECRHMLTAWLPQQGGWSQ